MRKNCHILTLHRGLIFYKSNESAIHIVHVNFCKFQALQKLKDNEINLISDIVYLILIDENQVSFLLCIMYTYVYHLDYHSTKFICVLSLKK